MSSSLDGADDESLSRDSLESTMNSFQITPNDLRLALGVFRNLQKELKEKHNEPNSDNSDQSKSGQMGQNTEELLEANDVPTLLAKDQNAEQQALAKNLFHKAVELEQSGKVYDDIPFYRKAEQIEPDIEHQKLKTSIINSTKLVLNTSVSTKPSTNLELGEPVMPENLYEKFQFDLSHNHHGQLIQNSCDPSIISTDMHISELPPELLIYLLRWVVSNHLDMRSLEQCAAVCKGMYILARDEELWKLACVKVWGHNVETLTNSKAKGEQSSIDAHCTRVPRYASWRNMFIERERVLFNGCYISENIYLRMNDNRFQRQYCPPPQMVENYNYIRLLPDGTVLMMTSSDKPMQGVAKLKNLHQIIPDILRGHYRLFGSTLSIVVSEHEQQTKFITNATPVGRGFFRHLRRGSAAHGESAANWTKYCLEFRISNTSKKKFAQLAWLHYSIVQTRNGHETTSEFELTPAKYPPLCFLPVRSYHLDADAPLAY